MNQVEKLNNTQLMNILFTENCLDFTQAYYSKRENKYYAFFNVIDLETKKVKKLLMFEIDEHDYKFLNYEYRRVK